MRLSLLTGGAERPIERVIKPVVPDRFEALLAVSEQTQEVMSGAVEKLLKTVGSLEALVTEKAIELARPEREARRLAEELAQSAQLQAKAAIDKASQAERRAEAFKEMQEETEALRMNEMFRATRAEAALETRSLETRVETRVEYLERKVNLDDVKINILKNGEGAIDRFVLKNPGHEDVAIFVRRDSQGNATNLVIKRPS